MLYYQHDAVLICIAETIQNHLADTFKLTVRRIQDLSHSLNYLFKQW